MFNSFILDIYLTYTSIPYPLLRPINKDFSIKIFPHPKKTPPRISP